MEEVQVQTLQLVSTLDVNVGETNRLKPNELESPVLVKEKEVKIEPKLGCPHYKRKCQLVCPEPNCDKVYTCRFCHDDKEPSHSMDRFAVKEVVCLICKERQPAGATCRNCSTIFGQYYCGVCNLYNDEDNKTFHCDGCGLCRVGPKENFFHCAKCDMCLPVKLEGNHKCVEKVSRSDCAVCLEDIHNARCPSHIPPCGHLIHQPCFEQLLKKAMYTCPQCNASMVDMESVWKHLDDQIKISPLPPQYANKSVYILCRDCHKFSTVLFHFIGLKCGSCGSFNTSIESGPILDEDMPVNDEADEDGLEDEDVFEDAQEVSELIGGIDYAQNVTDVLGEIVNHGNHGGEHDGEDGENDGEDEFDEEVEDMIVEPEEMYEELYGEVHEAVLELEDENSETDDNIHQ